ncbi:hypothetical protein COT48_02115 [Candidatus Woesearchaeota archaeon CG08_land_8_20_14_0_20_47_9]|nr:MAG: hypothetical protein COT48_02115 [Candidatus Woesearchaeota archaeon CG08_land_8_20_14_0_20_47_9]
MRLVYDGEYETGEYGETDTADNSNSSQGTYTDPYASYYDPYSGEYQTSSPEDEDTTDSDDNQDSCYEMYGIRICE